jgi:hypothetical protein
VLRFVYLPDAYEPTVVLWGPATAILILGSLLKELTASPRPIRLSKIDFCLPVDNTEMVIWLGARALGMRPPEGKKRILRWELDPARAEHFARLLDVVAGTGSPCHHYLECDAKGELTVKVSIGEYGDDFPRS